MKTQTKKQLLSELTKAIGKSLRAFFKSILYRLWRYETQSDRRDRIRAMQALLDAEHKDRLGWSCN